MCKCVYVCVHTCVGICTGVQVPMEAETLDFLQLELQMVVRRYYLSPTSMCTLCRTPTTPLRSM